MLDALKYLLDCTRGRFTGKREVVQSWFENTNHSGVVRNVEVRLPVHHLGEGSEKVTAGERTIKLRPKQQDEVHVTILPVLSDLQTNARQIMYCGPLDKRTRDLFDPMEESGVNFERGQPITGRQWMVQRLRSMFKGGPSDDVELIMSMLLRLEMSRLSQVQGAEDRLESRLMKHKGTREYFAKALDNIRATERCYGPANFSFSLSMNANSDHFLATFISQGRESEELKGLQVWESKDEEELLTLRPGKTRVGLECGYYVHQKTDVKDDSCMFHPHCSRTPLQDWSRW